MLAERVRSGLAGWVGRHRLQGLGAEDEWGGGPGRGKGQAKASVFRGVQAWGRPSSPRQWRGAAWVPAESRGRGAGSLPGRHQHRCLWRYPAHACAADARHLSSQPALPYRTLFTGAGPALGSSSQPLASARFPRSRYLLCTFELRQIFLIENCGGRPFDFCQ